MDLFPHSWPSAVLTLLQALLVALPAAGLPVVLHRWTGRAWALVLPASIVVVVGGLAVLPEAASLLTWLALLAIPPLAALTLAWGMHGARWWLALPVPALLVVAIAEEGRRPGQIAALLLTALSCVALARLLTGAVARGLGRGGVSALRVGLIAMAVIDAVLVFSGGLAQPNAVLNAATPAQGLPRLQFVGLEGASMGYGDVFVAATVGAILAAEGASRRLQWAAAGAAWVAGALFDQLFRWFDSLPATVPMAVVLVLIGGWRGLAARGDGAHGPGAVAP
ncbi:MAG: hypothetical protein M0P31_09595 [Solirubrobacteraceae bacterium]|nr:hypothetical protein [Solirubrobacteraceae bacterium]